MQTHLDLAARAHVGALFDARACSSAVPCPMAVPIGADEEDATPGAFDEHTRLLASATHRCQPLLSSSSSSSSSGIQKIQGEGALYRALGCEQGVRVNLVGFRALVTGRRAISRGLSASVPWSCEAYPRSRERG